MSLKTQKAVKSVALSNAILAQCSNAESMSEDAFSSLVAQNTIATVLVNLSAIKVGRFSTRSNGNNEDEDFRELYDSMLARGFTTPIFVWRENGQTIHLVAGERRYHVLRKLQSSEAAWFDRTFHSGGIPCILCRDEASAWQIAYAENMLRVANTDKEEYEYLSRMVDAGQLPANVEQAARVLNRTVERLRTFFRIRIDGDASVKELVQSPIPEYSISLSVAEKLAALPQVKTDGKMTQSEVVELARNEALKVTGVKKRGKVFRVALRELTTGKSGNTQSGVSPNGKEPAVKVAFTLSEDDVNVLTDYGKMHDSCEAGLMILFVVNWLADRTLPFPATGTVKAIEKSIAEAAKRDAEREAAHV